MKRSAMTTMVAIGLVGSVPGTAQQPAGTVQQAFEAATALADKPDQQEAALAAWQTLEKRVKPGSRSQSIVLVRKGGALFRLRRYDEALESLRTGLSGLPRTDASLREDRSLGFMMLGAALMENLDYAGGAAAYASALEAADAPSMKLGAMLALIKAQTFVDPKAAAATLASTDALVATFPIDKGVRSRLEKARSELRLNSGDVPGALTAATAAVDAAGGLTTSTDLVDVSVRSDAAIAYLLSGKPDKARQYMAMTGAGRLPKGDFDPASRMAPPDCGGDADLKPDDMAVVEFSIAPDGSTTAVSPVYAAGGGKVALEFTRAVRQWWWPVEEVAAIPAFFRYNVRVEMRCSRAFPHPNIGDRIDQAMDDWLTEHGVSLPDKAEGPAAIATQRALVDKAPAGSIALLAALFRLAQNWALPEEERGALYARAAAIAQARNVPALPRLAVDLSTQAFALAGTSGSRHWEDKVNVLLAQPFYATDPQANAALHFVLADVARSRRNKDRELLLLHQVADTAALAKSDPMRVGALVRIASLEERKGDVAAARSAFAATGLSGDQCALLDAPPHIISTGGVFPTEAQQWGFEGWTRTEFDVAADGRVLGERAVLSYPAFVFTKAGVAALKSSRFSKSYRPDGGLGCGSMMRTVKFRLGI
jgi:hypothetical protein